MILVTGASGLLGRHLIRFLSEAEPDVPIRALYHHTLPAVEYSNVIYQQCDLLDIIAVERVMNGVSEVYHCAAIVSFDVADMDSLVRQNRDATANVVNAALSSRVQKLIHVSSIAAIGREQQQQGALIHESMIWEEQKHASVYSKSKFMAEMEVWRGAQEGLNMAIVNPGIILGAGDWTRGSSKLMHKVAQGLKWYTQGVTSFVDVADVAGVMHLLMKSEVSNERFIVSSGNYAYKDIFYRMAKALQVRPPQKEAGKWTSGLIWRASRLKQSIFGGKPLITKETARTAHATYYFDNSKLLRCFPSFNYTALEMTLKRMADQYRRDNML